MSIALKLLGFAWSWVSPLLSPMSALVKANKEPVAGIATAAVIMALVWFALPPAWSLFVERPIARKAVEQCEKRVADASLRRAHAVQTEIVKSVERVIYRDKVVTRIVADTRGAIENAQNEDAVISAWLAGLRQLDGLRDGSAFANATS